MNFISCEGLTEAMNFLLNNGTVAIIGSFPCVGGCGWHISNNRYKPGGEQRQQEHFALFELLLRNCMKLLTFTLQVSAACEAARGHLCLHKFQDTRGRVGGLLL